MATKPKLPTKYWKIKLNNNITVTPIIPTNQRRKCKKCGNFIGNRRNRCGKRRLKFTGLCQKCSGSRSGKLTGQRGKEKFLRNKDVFKELWLALVKDREIKHILNLGSGTLQKWRMKLNLQSKRELKNIG